VVHKGFKRCFELLSEADYAEKDIKLITDLYSEAVVELDKSNSEEDVAFQNLMKNIGQYRFYLKKDKKVEFDELVSPLSKKQKLSYDYSDMNAISVIQNRIHELIAFYNKESKETNTLMYAAITKFIDDNEDDSTF
jgi:hypothetical protein